MLRDAPAVVVIDAGERGDRFVAPELDGQASDRVSLPTGDREFGTPKGVNASDIGTFDLIADVALDSPSALEAEPLVVTATGATYPTRSPALDATRSPQRDEFIQHLRHNGPHDDADDGDYPLWHLVPSLRFAER